MNRCDICLDEVCKKSNENEIHECHCSTCKNVDKCYKFLHPTIRLTTKCTQSCAHCCFSCSPEKTRMMSIETAKEITEFLKNNEIVSLNIMGGEFFCNPEWFEIITLFLEANCLIRLVSNSDWGNNQSVKEKLLKLKIRFNDAIHISLSKDQYHTNAYVDDAEEFLKQNGFKYNVSDITESDVDKGIVPIGRSLGDYGFYGMMCCYCQKPEHKYSFMIDEEGSIYKCSFGVWNYATVQEYKDGGFAARFKELNKRFYDMFIPSCTSCIRNAAQSNHIAEN